MKDSFFLDSNVLLYLLEDDDIKKEKAFELVFGKPFISTRVLNENINVCRRKFEMSKADINKHLNFIVDYCSVTNISLNTIDTAFNLSFKYGYSYYDSLILSSGLENDCQIVYSEDFQNNQLIEGKLRIINPFQ